MSKIYIGIDGGMSAAICVLKDNQIIDTLFMPTLQAGKSKREYDCPALIQFLKKYPKAIVCLEKAQYTPMLGGVQAFSFGQSYGTMIGMLSALGMSYHLVAARTWQKDMFRDVYSDNTKSASVLVAKRLYPNMSFLPTTRSKNAHNGLTDAVLIATWAHRRNL